MPGFSFTGFSRKNYTYHLTDLAIAAPLPLQGGNYIFATGVAINPIPVFVEAADSIRKSLSDNGQMRWYAENVLNARLFYFRPNPDARARAAEKADLIMAYKPQMNDPQTGKFSQ